MKVRRVHLVSFHGRLIPDSIMWAASIPHVRLVVHSTGPMSVIYDTHDRGVASLPTPPTIYEALIM